LRRKKSSPRERVRAELSSFTRVEDAIEKHLSTELIVSLEVLQRHLVVQFSPSLIIEHINESILRICRIGFMYDQPLPSGVRTNHGVHPSTPIAVPNRVRLGIRQTRIERSTGVHQQTQRARRYRDALNRVIETVDLLRTGDPVPPIGIHPLRSLHPWQGVVRLTIAGATTAATAIPTAAAAGPIIPATVRDRITGSWAENANTIVSIRVVLPIVAILTDRGNYLIDSLGSAKPRLDFLRGREGDPPPKCIHGTPPTRRPVENSFDPPCQTGDFA
ncbi:MAG: hypothetical protein RLN75_07960, partial [Longimicrobiales bacterium]